jgi:homogentisate 1,2-dioxygenase
MVGCVIKGGRGVRKLRVFDYFTGITGTPGVRLPVPYKGKGFRVDVYNLEGPQLVGFHRGCDEDEIHFQFRGSGVNETEWGMTELHPGEMSYIPRGVGHRTTGSKGFLRIVFYSRELVHPKVTGSGATPQAMFHVQ